ncbi:YitT family protein [Bacilliculturomica massiliensis]|uniref:YitT family protein n=1 Tax=Bacilliculturomica massiliensis TaxID=1917867 RepID=UPI0010308105|nr:YitT family protein [Bacilliculturomica massiliensis]
MNIRDRITGDSVKKFIIDMVFVFAGSAIGAFATNAVLIPNGLSGGGITGVCRILQQYVDFDFSLMYYVLALVVLVVCWIILGAWEAKKIIVMTIVYPAFLVLFEDLNFTLLEQKDMTLASVFYGLIAGVGSGLVFERGFSSGGTDTIAKIIKVKCLPHVGLSQILMCVDGAVIIASGFVFGTNIALYALISTIVFAKSSEMIMFGFDPKVVQLEIISDQREQIAEYISNVIQRGITNVEIMGEFSKEKKMKIVTICSPRESMLIKQFVAQLDRQAFVTVVHVDTVWGNGRGFSDISGS